MTPAPCIVFVLAGGLGTRLKELFPDQPKSMVPIAGRPFLEHQLLLLAGQGFRDFVLCVGYRAQQIESYFGDGAAWGLRLRYSAETDSLGTGGALKHAAALLNAPALVLNGDTYLSADYLALVGRHSEFALRGAVGTLGLVTVPDCSRYGQVYLGPDQRLSRFEEKQDSPPHAGLINAGAYVFEPAILGAIPSGRAVSLEHETFPALAASGARLYGMPLDGTFIDIGTPEGYTALELYLTGQPSASRR